MRQASWGRLTGLFVSSLFVCASANEGVLLDCDWTLTQHHQAKQLAFNLTTPTMYSPGGKIYVRMYITSMRTSKVLFQTCLYGCGSACVDETCNGCADINPNPVPYTYLYETGTLGQWWQNASYSGPAKTQVIDFCLKPNDCGTGGDPSGSQVPIVTHSTVVVVSPGATFSGWSHYPIPGVPTKVSGNVVQDDNTGIRINRIGPNSLSITCSPDKPAMVQVADLRGASILCRQLSRSGENSIILPNSTSGSFIVRVFPENGRACVQRIALVR